MAACQSGRCHPSLMAEIAEIGHCHELKKCNRCLDVGKLQTDLDLRLSLAPFASP
jgi:hypothetical protein